MKINATEIRIGNIIFIKPKYQDGWEQVVNPSTFSEIQVKQGREYSGIKLTEEWLIKLGFEEGQVGYYHINYFIVTVEGQVYYTEIECWIKEVSSIHQLQNLFFALTGEELKIKGLD